LSEVVDDLDPQGALPDPSPQHVSEPPLRRRLLTDAADAARAPSYPSNASRERQSISTAVEGAFGVVNAVSLYVERGTDTFQAVHVAAAERLAEEARKSWNVRTMRF
jgi:hypothetical protein